MLDFTSAHHLGLDHGSAGLEPWAALATGRPAALGETAGAFEAAEQLAQLVGAERGALYSSTLHLFVDVCQILAQRPTVFLYDEVLYPVLRWSMDCAAPSGSASVAFRHHNLNDLRRLCDRYARRGRVVVVTDGLCTGCGRPAPIDEYLAELRLRQGLLVVDDTQAVGVLGLRARRSSLGLGGGGSLRFWDEPATNVLWGASLAKAFGVPAAVLAGTGAAVHAVMRDGPTRWHCSPANAAAAAAVRNALSVNDERGDELRARVEGMSERLRVGLRSLGLAAFTRPLPFQATVSMDRARAQAVHARLGRRGLRCLLQQPRCRSGAALTFLVTASHRTSDIDRLVDGLAEAWRTDAPTNSLPDAATRTS